MKRSLLALALISACAFASAHTIDTLDTYSQYGHQQFGGRITQLDKEDAIGQVEINDAILHWTGNDLIFYNGFEKYNINWTWIGEVGEQEFGYAADCTHETDWTDNDGNLHVTLLGCFIFVNEVSKQTE